MASCAGAQWQVDREISRGIVGGGAGKKVVSFPSIPRPAATAGGLLSHSGLPLAGLVSSFPRNARGDDLTDPVGLSRLHTHFTSRQRLELSIYSHITSTSTNLLYRSCCNKIHKLTWLLTQIMEMAMLPTSHQLWHPSSPAFLKSRPK